MPYYKEGDIVEVFRGDPDWQVQWQHANYDGKLFGHRFALTAKDAEDLNGAKSITENDQKYVVNYDWSVLRIVSSKASREFTIGDWVVRKQQPHCRAIKITHDTNISDRFICGIRRDEVRLATPEEINAVGGGPREESDLDKAERLANSLSSRTYPDTEGANQTKVVEDDFTKAERLANELTGGGCGAHWPSREDDLRKAERLAESVYPVPHSIEVGGETYKMINTSCSVGQVEEEEKCMPPILLNRPRKKQRSIMVEKMQMPVMYHAPTGKHKLL